MRRKDCTHFTFAHKKCWLKNSGLGKQLGGEGVVAGGVCRESTIVPAVVEPVPTEAPTPTPSTAAPTPAKAPITGNCVANFGVNFFGSDLKTNGKKNYLKSLKLGDVKEEEEKFDKCATACLAREECSHFTVAYNRCFLKKSDAATRDASSVIEEGIMSGVCRGTSGAGIEEDAPPQCISEPNTDYFGYDLKMSNKEQRQTRNKQPACVVACLAREDCAGYSFIQTNPKKKLKGVCYLKSSELGRRPSTKGTSARCRAVSNDAKMEADLAASKAATAKIASEATAHEKTAAHTAEIEAKAAADQEAAQLAIQAAQDAKEKAAADTAAPTTPAPTTAAAQPTQAHTTKMTIQLITAKPKPTNYPVSKSDYFGRRRGCCRDEYDTQIATEIDLDLGHFVSTESHSHAVLEKDCIARCKEDKRCLAFEVNPVHMRCQLFHKNGKLTTENSIKTTYKKIQACKKSTCGSREFGKEYANAGLW
jgi:hypothetical protein